MHKSLASLCKKQSPHSIMIPTLACRSIVARSATTASSTRCLRLRLLPTASLSAANAQTSNYFTTIPNDTKYGMGHRDNFEEGTDVKVGRWQESNIETFDFLLSKTPSLCHSPSSSSRPRAMGLNRGVHGHTAIFAPYLKAAKKRNETLDDDAASSASLDTSEGSLTSILMELKDGVETNDVLKCFWKHDVGIAQIESCPVSETKKIFVEFDSEVGDANVNSLLRELKRMAGKLRVLDENEKEG